MIIKKNLPISCLEIDSKNGNIWLNSNTCVLRMSGVKFKTKIEKFSHINIVNNEAYVAKVEVDENDETLNNFLISITQILYPIMSNKPPSKQKQFYKKLQSSIKNFIELEG